METIVSARREQITQVAQNMFRERGYSATSMRDLARNIGIEPASLYSHISSKEEILKEICFRIAGEFYETIDPIMQLQEPARMKLSRMIAAHVQIIIQNQDASAVFFNEWRFLKEPALANFKELRSGYERIFKSVLSEGIAAGEFKAIDINLMSYSIFAGMNHVHEWYKQGEGEGAAAIGKTLAELLLGGISND